MLATRNFSGRTKPVTMKTGGSCWLLLLVLPEILVLKERNTLLMTVFSIPLSLLCISVVFEMLLSTCPPFSVAISRGWMTTQIDTVHLQVPFKGQTTESNIIDCFSFMTNDTQAYVFFRFVFVNFKLPVAVFSPSVILLLVFTFVFLPSSSCVVTHVKGEFSV